jgi:hypothetical protein
MANIENLKKLYEVVLKHKEHVYMSVYFGYLNSNNQLDDSRNMFGKDLDMSTLFTDCNTVGCLAGWACAILNINTGIDFRHESLIAMEWLGLGQSFSRFVFHGTAHHVFSDPESYDYFEEKALEDIDSEEALHRLKATINYFEKQIDFHSQATT